MTFSGRDLDVVSTILVVDIVDISNNISISTIPEMPYSVVSITLCRHFVSMFVH